jgi:uncharacterized membrane protein YcaP (DUF421 family)
MEIVFRSVLIYLFLFVITRALGKAALAQMNVFELLLLLWSPTSSNRRSCRTICR